MKGFLQSTLLNPLDFVQFTSSDWSTLPKKAEPTGGETIDEVVGWCHELNFQGKFFRADHYHVAEITDGVRVTAWNDDPVDYPPGERYARVVDFLHCVANSRLGGAITTRQTEVVFAEVGARARMSEAIGRTFELWSSFVLPASNVMHGIKVSDQLHLDHEAAQTSHGWREWTEGLDPSELDGNGNIKQQRPQGRFPAASGTRTYFMQDEGTARASGVHVATDEIAFETTADAGSADEKTANSTDELSFLFTTPSNEPDQGTWTTGVFRASFDVSSIGADMECGLLTLGGSDGHFGRVNDALSSEVDTKQQTQAAITSTGITVVDTGSVTFGGTTQNDRFEIMVAQRSSATMGGSQRVTLTCDADASADGPWPAAGAAGIPLLMHSYRTRRVP